MHHGTWPFKDFWTLGPRCRAFVVCSLFLVAAVGCSRTCSGARLPDPQGYNFTAVLGRNCTRRRQPFNCVLWVCARLGASTA